ncbi:MAG: DUF1269 domain-containing protein [Actinocatenispora sp.]
MADLVVLSFDSFAGAAAFWQRGRDRPTRRPGHLTDAALLWRRPDGTAQIETARHRGASGPPVHANWATVVGALFVVPVAHAAADVTLRRPGEAGLDDALVRRTAGSLTPGAGAIVALMAGRRHRVEAVARWHGARVVRAAMTAANEIRLVRALGRVTPWG